MDEKEKLRLKIRKDFIFKNIFADEHNKFILIDLLETILNIKIKDIKIEKDVSLKKRVELEKLGILDIKATLNDETIVNIEMQIKDNKDMIPRTIFYASKLMSEQLYTEKTYSALKKVVVISILDYYLFKESKQYHNIFYLKEKNNNSVLSDLVTFHYIELPKFEKENNIDTKLSEWLNFINGKDKEKISMAIKNNVVIAKAQEKYKYLEGDAELKRIEEIKLIQKLDDNSAIERATEEGKIKKQIEVVKNMLNSNIDIEVIKIATKLPEEEIIKIKSNLNV